MAAILIFKFLVKIAKLKKAYISKTVQDKAILMKVLTHRASLQSSHLKIFVSPKNDSHFELLNFSQNFSKHKNACISKTVRDRLIPTKLLAVRVSLWSSHTN